MVEPPDEPSVPVVSKVFIGEPPVPCLTRMKRVLSDEYTDVKSIVAEEAAASIYEIKVLAALAALFDEKSVAPMVKVEVAHAVYG